MSSSFNLAISSLLLVLHWFALPAGALLILLFSICELPVFCADNFQRPLIAISGSNHIADSDRERILRNYSGQKTNFDSMRQSEGTISFTLYPDGTLKWIHRDYRFGGHRSFDEETFKRVVEALRKSSPLTGKIEPALQRPQKCNLSFYFKNGNLIPKVGFEEPVLYGKYYYHRNSPALDTDKWLTDNLSKIKSNISASQLQKLISSKSLVAVWISINPDGLIDDLEMVPPDNLKGKNIAGLKNDAQELVKVVKRVQPFNYRASKVEPGGPVELLLIFDYGAKEHLKLVSARSAGYHIKFIVDK